MINKIKFIALSLIIFFLSGCTVSDPNNSEYAMDPNIKILLIVLCSLFTAGMLGYGIYFYIKSKKNKNN